jgi:indolepyruvate ferredoxin oxidoreductase alpha subunit
LDTALNQKIVQYLTSYEQPQEVCVTGNDAIVRGAIEAGVGGVFSYPGTPSTEISEAFSRIRRFQLSQENTEECSELAAAPIYFEYSVNEKVALEKAIAFAIGKRFALCCMKNVGLNVASDALMTIPYQTIAGSLVIVVCDDPGCHSSSNEQDSRHWGKHASVPLFDPATPEEAFEMTRQAFALSEKIRLPVIVRMTTRVSHSRGSFDFQKIAAQAARGTFERSPRHINIPAKTATAHQKLLDKLSSEIVIPFNHKFNRITRSKKKSEYGVIVSGVPSAYFLEQASTHQLIDDLNILKIGLINPFPRDVVLDFLELGIKKILVLEELDPIVENAVRIVAQKNAINVEIFGKDDYRLSPVGEYSQDIVNHALALFTGKTLENKTTHHLPGSGQLAMDLPIRPPSLCTGCPHRATYYGLKLALPREKDEVIMCGDIGCLGLGGLAPLKMMDTVNHMGMSVSMAQGLDRALGKSSSAKIIALLGDGSFFHSAIPSLLNAVYTNANMTVIVFDNRTIAMTGCQDNPGAREETRSRHIDIEALIRGLGVEYVESIDPFELNNTCEKIKQAVDFQGVSVLVSKSPCIMLAGLDPRPEQKIVVDQAKCKTCANHEDPALNCSQVCDVESGLTRARAKSLGEKPIEASEQLCPANICNHGFISAIQAENYKTALEIVRDKMLFAHTCGEICHRPCEGDHGDKIPIRYLKKFVASLDDHFFDFSQILERTAKQEKKDLQVAIIGGGPAGLSSAYDLVQAGYDISIYERDSKAGGLLTHVIPNFRLDKTKYDQEIELLEQLGVDFQYNMSLGESIHLPELADEFDAVIIATGLGQATTIPIIESSFADDRKFESTEFLRLFNADEVTIKPGATVMVIGGGNSAMDAARSAQKLNPGGWTVISCLEEKSAMPAFQEEIAHAYDAGITILDDSCVERVNSLGSGLCQVHLNRYGSGESLHSIDVDYVITAIGQRAEGLLSAGGAPVKWDSMGRIADAAAGMPDNIFIAGDLVADNHQSLIGAIGSGKKAAIAVRKVLENYAYDYEGQAALDKLTDENSGQRSFSTLLADADIKIDPQLIHEKIKPFNLHQTCERCNHCIDNFGCPSLHKLEGHVVIDQQSCIRCGLCIDVCPNDAIHWTAELDIEMLVAG